jgi:dGTPase
MPRATVTNAVLDHSREIEDKILSDYATKSIAAQRQFEEKGDIRPNFFHDTDRILHSKSFTRYIDKTQVFYLFDNDDITHRVLHVQFVSKIARVIGRSLELNEDLIEAIALGHDLGHPPFGHEGETYLDTICVKNKVNHFVHSVQSVIFLDNIERRLRGKRSLNLSLQVLDGILCHDGEKHDKCLSPDRNKTWSKHLQERIDKTINPKTKLIPMTLEGCVVRFADTVSYIGRDIEDAITIKLIKRKDLPKKCTKILGNDNRSIINTLVTDIIETSKKCKNKISYSNKISKALKELKQFNYKRIYLNKRIKTESSKIEKMYGFLFSEYMKDLKIKNETSEIYKTWIAKLKNKDYLKKAKQAEICRDFIASMTDDYFISRFERRYYPERFGMHLANGKR